MIARENVANAVWAARRLRLRVRTAPSALQHGNDFHVSPDARIARGCSLHVGDRVSVGPRFICFADVKIGDDVMISANVGFIGDDHPFDDSDRVLTNFQARTAAAIVLEGDNLIGYGATIMGPVTVGRGAIVGAQSLVKTDVPAGAIVAGTPARVVSWRRKETPDGS